MKLAITYAVIMTAISVIQYFVIKKRNKRISYISKTLDNNYKYSIHRANKINKMEALLVDQANLIDLQANSLELKDKTIKSLLRIATSNIASNKAWEGHKE